MESRTGKTAKQRSLASMREVALKEQGPEPYLSVTETIRLFNDTLEVQFPQLLFRGEISQIQVAQSGHVYYTVKDESAQVSCVMWAGMARTLAFKPVAGMKVKCHGKPNIYPQSGRFQLVVHRMVLDGEGELQRRFLELKARLEADGFFAPERKRSLPFLPKAVGIVTSSTGAVIHDMMVKIRERFPAMITYLVDTRVQGEGAAKEISEAIGYLDASKLVDVIIVARGGGSLEDLWAFNEEAVVKAVFRCSVPVVSGVGHEVDVTLCDLVSDVRAPTPTAAAEMVVPRCDELFRRVSELERRLADTDRWFQPRVQRVDELAFRLDVKTRSAIEQIKLKLEAVSAKIWSIRPDKVIHLLGSKVALLAGRIGAAGVSDTRRRADQVRALHERLSSYLTPTHLAHYGVQITTLGDRLNAASSLVIERAHGSLDGLSARLVSVSPRAVMERGFAAVRAGGSYVKSVDQLSTGVKIEVVLADGLARGTVDEVREGGVWETR
jgi:exodeoxyribonuclease VII large subunit